MLFAGRGGLGGPDGVQDGQVVGVGEGLVSCLGGRVLLAVVVQHRGEHAERGGRRGGRGGHRQAGMDRAALGGVIGDRVAELGFPVVRVQERPGGPPALPGPRVGIQGAADEQALSGDGVDAEQVAVG